MGCRWICTFTSAKRQWRSCLKTQSTHLWKHGELSRKENIHKQRRPRWEPRGVSLVPRFWHDKQTLANLIHTRPMRRGLVQTYSCRFRIWKTKNFSTRFVEYTVTESKERVCVCVYATCVHERGNVLPCVWKLNSTAYVNKCILIIMGHSTHCNLWLCPCRTVL